MEKAESKIFREKRYGMKKKALWLLVIPAVMALALLVKPAIALYEDISFGWTEHTETEIRVKEYADAHAVRYSAYPKSLIALLERNPETEEFVLNYPFRETGAGADLSGTPRDTVPLFMQWDTRWGYEKYGSDCIGITGCGPTCLSMVYYYLTGDTAMTPGKVAEFAGKNGYYAKGYGSSWTLISEGGEKLGLSVTELPLVKKKLTDNLEAGYPIILALGKGDFTSSGHYIVLTGVEDGLFRVNDPNSHANSEQLWSYDRLEGQIRNIWVLKAVEE